MRSRRPYVIFTFHTTMEAMAMEQACGKAGIPGRLIPVPREITAGCGLAWRMPAEQVPEYRERLEGLSLVFEGQYELEL